MFGLFNIVALVYGLFAVGIALQLKRNGRGTFDDHFTPHDRRIAGAAAFYLVAPIAVALHELGHAGATWLLGGHIEDWHFMFYWGYVVPAREPAFSPLEDAFTAAAGNLVSLALGFGAIAWTLRHRVNAAWNYARLEVARILLWLTLVFYPVMSLLLDSWDFAIMRRGLNETQAYLGDAAMVLYAGFAVWVWRRWRGPWRQRYLWLATPLFDRMHSAGRRVEVDPDNVEALRELARVFLAGDEAVGALAPLERALRLRPGDPETRFLAGLAYLRVGEPRTASEHLRTAGGMLEEGGPSAEQADLYFEITLGLAAARLALDDADGAVLTVESARSRRPADPRVVLLHADALAAAGRREEARGRLEGALGEAHGTFAAEIKRRLKALG